MSKAAHTPGPWTMETVQTSAGLCHKIGPFPSPARWKADRPAYACVYDDYPPLNGTPELVANARLMTVAPEMLVALQDLTRDDDHFDDFLEALARARTVIAKATGAA